MSAAKARTKLKPSIVITTRNRCKDVLRAIESCLAQDHPDLEIIVYDDASEDCTSNAIAEKFPIVKVVSLESRQGYLINRNRGFCEASGAIVFSIDDDAYFSEPDVVSRTLELFRTDDSIGGVAIPYIEPLNRKSLSSLHHPFSAKPGECLRSYVGCAHAIRRDLALELGGYREFFVHQGEERDLCIRMQNAGYKIVYGDSGYVVHTVSPNRQTDRIIYYGARNQIFFEVFNTPVPDIFIRLPWIIQGTFRYKFSFSRLPLKLRGIASGLVESLRRFEERAPVDRSLYRRYRKQSNHGPEEWAGEIPPPCHTATQP